MRNIIHQGIIEEIHEEHVIVGVNRTPACFSCSAVRNCVTSAQHQQIEVIDTSRKWTVGEKVTLCISVPLLSKMVMWAYILPLFIVLSILIVALRWGNEIWAAVSSLVALSIYYLILFFCRSSLHRKIRFSLTLVE